MSQTKKAVPSTMLSTLIRMLQPTGCTAFTCQPKRLAATMATRQAQMTASRPRNRRRELNMLAKIRMPGKASTAASWMPSETQLRAHIAAVSVKIISAAACLTRPQWVSASASSSSASASASAPLTIASDPSRLITRAGATPATAVQSTCFRRRGCSASPDAVRCFSGSRSVGTQLRSRQRVGLRRTPSPTPPLPAWRGSWSPAPACHCLQQQHVGPQACRSAWATAAAPRPCGG